MEGKRIFEVYENVSERMREKDILEYRNDKRLYLYKMLCNHVSVVGGNDVVTCEDVEILRILIDAYIDNFTDYTSDN